MSYLRTFCTRMPATTPIVVGKLAAHTPSRFRVLSSMLAATTRGGAHWGAETSMTRRINTQQEKHGEREGGNAGLQRNTPSLRGRWAGCVPTRHSHSHPTPSRSDPVHCRPVHEDIRAGNNWGQTGKVNKQQFNFVKCPLCWWPSWLQSCPHSWGPSPLASPPPALQTWQGTKVKDLIRWEVGHLKGWKECTPDAIHEVWKVLHCGDVVVVGLKWHVWVDISVGGIDKDVSKNRKHSSTVFFNHCAAAH